jgi:AraC-like DNA-binding protein
MSHTITFVTPRPELQEFVIGMGQREMCLGDATYSQVDAASLEHILSFSFSGRPFLNFRNGKDDYVPLVHLVGSQPSPLSVAHFTEHVFAFGIFLKPFASWQLFRIPPSEFATLDFDATTVFGRWIQELWLRLAEPQTLFDRIRIAEEYLLPLARNRAPLTPTMKTAQLLLNRNAPPVRQLAFHAAMSLRSYERRFSAEIGISPKLFARIARFQRAVDAKRTSGDSWLAVAHEAGYFDQMHMVRDFHNLGGRAPSELINTVGDVQPWSLGPPLTANQVFPQHSRRYEPNQRLDV